MLTNCLECSQLWNRTKPSFCNPSFYSRSFDDYSIVTQARCFGEFLQPTKLLFNFGEWVVTRYFQLFSRSYNKLCTLPQMIKCVYNSYILNVNNPPNLPNSHGVSYFIIKRIGKRLLSVYCSRLSNSAKGKNLFKYI